MKQNRRLILLGLLIFALVGYVAGFLHQLQETNLNFGSAAPRLPIIGYYFSDNPKVNVGLYYFFWPLAKCYEARWYHRAVFLSRSPYAPEDAEK